MKLPKLEVVLVIALLVGFLTGCSSFGGTPEPITVAEVPAVIETVEPLTQTVVNDAIGSIAIGTLLNKLVLSGCKIDNLKYREVVETAKKGGHVEVQCLTTTTDSLDLDTDL